MINVLLVRNWHEYHAVNLLFVAMLIISLIYCSATIFTYTNIFKLFHCSKAKYTVFILLKYLEKNIYSVIILIFCWLYFWLVNNSFHHVTTQSLMDKKITKGSDRDYTSCSQFWGVKTAKYLLVFDLFWIFV